MQQRRWTAHVGVWLILLVILAGLPAGRARAADLPDLRVTDVGIVESDYGVGDTVHLYAVFRNDGTAAVQTGWLGLSWFVDGEGVTWQGVGPAEVAPGQEIRFTGRDTYTITRSSFRLSAFIDDNRIIDESDETNNILEVTINVVPDQEPPSVPRDLRLLGVNDRALALGWSASTDNKGVTGYTVFVNGARYATISPLDTFTELSGLAPNTSYTLSVAAFDKAGNVSAPSAPLVATTAATPQPTKVHASYKLLPGVDPTGLRLRVAQEGTGGLSERVVLEARYGQSSVFRLVPDGTDSYVYTTFTLDPGTYTVLLQKPGYEYRQEHIVIPRGAYVDYTGPSIARYRLDGMYHPYRLLAPDRPVSRATLAQLSRGVNNPVIWGQDWLSRYDKSEWTTIKQAGFTYVRMFTEYNNVFDPNQPSVLKPEYSERIYQIVQDVLDSGLGVMVTVRIPPDIWSDKTYRSAESFAAFWKTWAAGFQQRFRQTPNYQTRVFLEICNEPWAETPAEWNIVQDRVMMAMREGAPELTLIAASNLRLNPSTWDNVRAFPGLTPVADNNVVYTFHQYNPYVFTHQEVLWHGWIVLKEVRDLPYPVNTNDDPWRYIAPAPDKPAGSAPDPETVSVVTDYIRTGWNQQKLAEMLQPVFDWQARYRRPVIANEFGNNYSEGTFGGIPAPYSQTFNHDSRQLFEAHGIGWALWAYPNLKREGQPNGLDHEMLEALGLEAPTLPDAPRQLRVERAGADAIRLRWEAATDWQRDYTTGQVHTAPVYAYDIVVDGRMVGFVAGDTTTYTLTGIDLSQPHRFQVRARDTIGNASRFARAGWP
jgi:hypothetical protein